MYQIKIEFWQIEQALFLLQFCKGQSERGRQAKQWGNIFLLSQQFHSSDILSACGQISLSLSSQLYLPGIQLRISCLWIHCVRTGRGYICWYHSRVCVYAVQYGIKLWLQYAQWLALGEQRTIIVVMMMGKEALVSVKKYEDTVVQTQTRATSMAPQ